VKVEFWGPARDLTGVGSLDLSFVRPNGITVGFLREQLGAEFPRLALAGGSLRLAVNEEFVKDNRKLVDGDVVAVIPPVSGG
jgi:molybdopterin converting factor small subunit